MLTTRNGERVYDAEDMEVLMALWTILDLIERRMSERIERVNLPARTAAELHLVETGHALKQGCCKHQRHTRGNTTA